jgi:hypothetical protein
MLSGGGCAGQSGRRIRRVYRAVIGAGVPKERGSEKYIVRKRKESWESAGFWHAATPLEEPEPAAVNLAQPPAGAKVREIDDGHELTLRPGNVQMAVVLLVMAACITTPFALAVNAELQEPGAVESFLKFLKQRWMPVLIVSPIVLVIVGSVLWMVYVGVWAVLGVVRVRVRSGGVEVFTGVGRIGKVQRLAGKSFVIEPMRVRFRRRVHLAIRVKAEDGQAIYFAERVSLDHMWFLLGALRKLTQT